MTDSSQAQTQCLAREIELEKLHGFLQEALDGQRSVCFVTGEAGAGKTSLLTEFCRVARMRYPELVIADGHCNAQTGIGDPYLPFREILTELAGGADERDMAPNSPPTDSKKSVRWFRIAAQALIEHGPDLIDLFVPGGAIMTRVGAQAVRSTGLGKKKRSTEKAKIVAEAGGLEQRHLCEQYTNVLKALAKQHPVLIIIDDLHWSDDASIHLLFHLSRRLAEERILIMGAYRNEDVLLGRGGERHPLEATLNEIKRYYGDATVAVAEFDDDGSRFVDALIDSQPNHLSRDFRTALRRHTDGHALFTVELLRHLQETGNLVKDDSGHWIEAENLSWDKLPARVEGIVHERVARLDDREREYLLLASVEGEPFNAEIISSTLGFERRDVIRSLSGPLAKRHALVRPLGIGRTGGVRLSQYAFRQKIFQNFFYQSLDAIQLTQMHEEIGLSMEALFENNVDAIALQLARHFAIAENTEKAVHYLLVAAAQSSQAYANSETLRHLKQAQQLIDRDDSLPTAWTQNTRRQLFQSLGKAHEINCDYEQARSSFSDALSLTPEDRRTECASLHRAMAVTWERQSDHEAALDELRLALEILGDEARAEQVDWWREWLAIKLGQMWLHYWTADSDKMERLIADVEPFMEQRGDAFQRRRYCVSVAMLGYRKERYLLSDNTITAVDKALAVSEEAGSLVEQADALFGAGFARLCAGQPKESVNYLKRSVDLSRRCGDLRIIGRSLTYLNVAHRQLGNADEVENTTANVLEAIEASSAIEYRAVVKANESWLAWKSGDDDQSRALADDAIRIWQKEAPKYPLKWLAMMQLIAIAAKEDRAGDGIALSRDLLQAPHALLGGGVGHALHQAVALYEDQQAGKASAILAEAVECAKNAGYL